MHLPLNAFPDATPPCTDCYLCSFYFRLRINFPDWVIRLGISPTLVNRRTSMLASHIIQHPDEPSMSIATTSLADVTEGTLLALLAASAREDKTLEFKRDAYGGNDDSKVEFLADVSALANTAGGDLIIGMEEADGIAVSLVGLAGDADAEVLRLQQMATTGIQPRLPALDIRAVPLASGRHVIVLRIGRSYNPPHRVVFKNRNRFYVRGPAGRYEPDVDGLRALFNATPVVAERIREFRAGRLGIVLADATPVRLRAEAGRLVLHIIPFSSVEGSGIPLNLLGLDTEAAALRFLNASGLDYRTNLDGFVAFRLLTQEGSGSYCQVFRSGAAEVVIPGMVIGIDEGDIISADQVANHVRHHVRNVVPLLYRRGAAGPCAILVSLTAVQGARLTVEDATWKGLDEALPIPGAIITFVEAVVPERASAAEADQALRPILDQLGQGMGLAGALDRWLS